MTKRNVTILQDRLDSLAHIRRVRETMDYRNLHWDITPANQDFGRSLNQDMIRVFFDVDSEMLELLDYAESQPLSDEDMAFVVRSLETEFAACLN